MVPLNRDELMRLANERLKDTGALLEANRFEAAFYLVGYVVECALKACIARQTREHDFPDKE